METVLTTLHWTTCLVYLDDIIFSRTVEEHLNRLKEVFGQAGLKNKPIKCCLLRRYVQYLGLLFLEVDPKKKVSPNGPHSGIETILRISLLP